MRYLAIYLTTFIACSTLYLLSSGLLYLIFWKGTRLEKMRLPIRYKGLSQPKSELWMSLAGLAVLCLNGPLLELIRCTTGYTRAYTSISQYGWPYFIVSIFIMAFLTDTYFYWAHRLSHRKGIYLRLHAKHHQFANPTPFGGFAFSIPEVAIFTFSIFLITMIFHWHPLALCIYSALSIFWNSFIHLGYNPLTARVFDKTLCLPSHHGIHHDEYQHNYGLYFMFWDRLCGTYKK